VLRAWIVNIGRRPAFERVAHLMCELHLRLKNVGFAPGGDVALPLTQETLADAFGLTPLHVNRVLQRLRAEGLIELKGGRLRIPSYRRLRDAAGFNPNYLHIDDSAAD
jgi:CRP-like cAMP-binding protein